MVGFILYELNLNKKIPLASSSLLAVWNNPAFMNCLRKPIKSSKQNEKVLPLQTK